MSFPSSPIQPTSEIIKTQTSQASQASARNAVVQEAIKESLEEFIDQFSVNTMQIIRRNSDTLEEKIRKFKSSSNNPEKAEGQDDIPHEIEATVEVSDYYENKNPDLKAKSLQSLKEQISKFDTSEDILQKVLEAFPEPVTAEAAIEYLLKTLPDELREKIKEAQDKLEKRFSRKLQAGKNIFEESLKFAEEGLSTPSELRETYSQLTAESRSTLDTFEELLNKFTFEKMTQAISFWLSALGADLNSKGSSIEKGELHKLIEETRTLQAILGVYNYFSAKQRELILSLVRHNALATPEMNYQNLAKIFVKILQDPYPSPDKILFYKNDLNIVSNLASQEAVFNVMCSAIKNVSPRLYRNNKHKDEVLSCFLIALEAIDNVMEDQS